jgi:heptosyltransferase-2
MSSSDTDNIQRVVLRAPNWLGDAVLALPAMAALRRHFSSANVTVAALPSIAPLFREITQAAPDAVVELPARHAGAVESLRSGSYDACVLFPNSFRSAWQARRAGIPHRWGFAASGRSWLLTRRISRPAAREHGHQADYYRQLARGLGAASDPGAPPTMLATPSSIEQGLTLLRRHRWPETAPFVAMMPGAAYGQAKQWPADRWADVIQRIVREREVRCVIFGAAHDRAASRAVESSLRARAPDVVSRVLDLAGETTLGALVGLLSRADLCVSNDSGAMHVAAALGRPVVAIFGPTDERVTRPVGDHEVLVEPVFCRPCMLRDCPIDHRCMRRLSADRVFNAAAGRLASGRSA